MEPIEQERPLGISVLSIAGFIVGCWHLMIGMFGLAYASSMVMITVLGGYIPRDDAMERTVWAIVSTIASLGLIVGSLGLWTLRKWAYWLTLGASGLALLTRVIPGLQGIGNGTSAFSAFLAAAILVYLLLPGTRRAFFEPSVGVPVSQV